MDPTTADTITINLPTPPEKAYVDVAFYDAAEESLLRSAHSPTFRDIPARWDLGTSEICAYYRYYKLRPGISGFRTRQEIFSGWNESLVEISGQCQFANHTVQLLRVDGTNRSVLEHLGEAIGLCVADKIHELHQADWQPIRPNNIHKTLDFEYRASDASTLITLETKGASAADNSRKTSNVSQKRWDIKKKKSANGGQGGICYGTITVLSGAPDSVAKCWLVDPPGASADGPFRFKLLARLEFIAGWAAFLSPRSALGAALRTRIAALRVVESLDGLNGLALCKADGGEFAETVLSMGGVRRNPFFAAQSVVSGHAIGGAVSVISPKQMLFLGIREELVGYAVGQNFKEINLYGFDPITIGGTLDCCIPKARFVKEFSHRFQIPEVRESGGYARFQVDGKFYQTRSGMVFGILPIPESWVANLG